MQDTFPFKVMRETQEQHKTKILYSVGELANLTQEKMKKRRQSPICVLRIAPSKKMISSVDGQNITVMMLKILQ
jgi:hypothetical protein